MSDYKRGKGFVGLVPPQAERPKLSFDGPAALFNTVRDQLTISAWLCIGAVVQASLYAVAGQIAFLPAFLILATRILDTGLVLAGIKHNKLMDGVIMKKYSAQFPDDVGRYGNQAAAKDVTVFIIGIRCNHPLGLLAPGMTRINQYFSSMAKNLSEHREEFGMLDMRYCLDASNRKTGSQIVNICYFKSVEQLHAFAHHPYHREGWDWFNKNAKAYPHISIFHETYHVPKGHYENIYINSQPSGITASTQEIFDQETGQNMWASPIVDASKGGLKTSAGRMARSEGTEHDNYGATGY